MSDFVGHVAQSGCTVFIMHARKAVLAGLSPSSLAATLWVFAIARFIHMVLYYGISTEKNPSPRSYFYMIALLSNLVLIVMIGIHLAA